MANEPPSAPPDAPGGCPVRQAAPSVELFLPPIAMGDADGGGSGHVQHVRSPTPYNGQSNGQGGQIDVAQRAVAGRARQMESRGNIRTSAESGPFCRVPRPWGYSSGEPGEAPCRQGLTRRPGNSPPLVPADSGGRQGFTPAALRLSEALLRLPPLGTPLAALPR